jgi:hypothetical protein
MVSYFYYLEEVEKDHVYCRTSGRAFNEVNISDKQKIVNCEILIQRYHSSLINAAHSIFVCSKYAALDSKNTNSVLF